MTEPVVFAPRMSDAEALMWRLEKDPFLSSTVANVTITDIPVDHDRLRRRMAHAVRSLRRFTQRVGPGAGVQPPAWVDDVDFSLDYHLRRIAIPSPGTERELFDLVTLLAALPFDRTRPLWEMYVIEGLSGGRGAFVMKFHHTLIDGEGGVKLSLQFLDLERDPGEPEPIEPEQSADEPEPSTAAPPNPLDLMREITAANLRLPIAMAKETLHLLADPRRVPKAGAAAASTMRGIVKQLTDTAKARSPLWTGRSLNRRFETLRVPFDEVKQATKGLGGTVNTAFVTAAAAAAGDYHRALGVEVSELRASMAISTRSAESKGANAFTLARLLVPTGEMPVAERFTRIQALADAARGESSSASLDTLAAVAATLPTSLIVRLARQQTETVDFGTSNVRGAPFPLYIGGARIEANYPVGPTAGTAFNLTMLSYAGSLDMGLNIDTDAIEEPNLLRERMQAAFDDLVSAG